MVRAAGDLFDALSLELIDRGRREARLQAANTQLSIVARAPCPDLLAVARGRDAMRLTSGDGANLVALKAEDRPRRLVILEVAVAQLAPLSDPP